jgi:phosphoribosylcarboxyaminoimidazole (NCAIR) mutase
MVGMTLERYQRTAMGIRVEVPQRKIGIVVGSKSDIPQLTAGLQILNESADYRVDVFSCHRNFSQLADWTEGCLSEKDVIIACAGMAAHLPGWIKSKLCAMDRPELPVIGVALEGKTQEDDFAAITAISRLPGQPVEMDDDGQPYFGPEGFARACQAAVTAEFLPRDVERKDPVIGYITGIKATAS